MPNPPSRRVPGFAMVRGEASAPWALPGLPPSSTVASQVARACCPTTAARAAFPLRDPAVPAGPTPVRRS